MGRPKKYTAASLQKGVAAYFDSIRYEQVVTRDEVYEDEDGNAKTRRVIARDAKGRPITEPVWRKTPGVAGLCLHLRISRDTWANYGRDPGMGPIVQEARMIVEDYWNEQLADDCKGARFALEANMGWGERWTTKQEVVHDVGNSLEEFLKSQEDGDA